jgi:nicotinate-nucleotide pyrophosphorylase (carboxylating)
MMEIRGPSASTERALRAAGLDPADVARVLATAFAEDFAHGGDVTSDATVPAEQRSRALVASRAAGCLAGVAVAAVAFEALHPAVSTEIRMADGSRVSPGDVVLVADGPTRALLGAERTALNLLCHLSGVATATRRWADALEGTGARVRDTRKTLPGLRALQKYAVRCGGGTNHRMSLGDAALVKDNHVVAAGGVAEAFRRVRDSRPDLVIEVEVDTVAQFREVLAAGADLVLLDNMPSATLRECVEIAAAHRHDSGRPVLLEASGGLSIERAREVGETGVDFLSVGALTHSAAVLDLGVDLQPLPPSAT